ncbi:MAG: hypothetical protein QOD86_1233 [Miltoncostaeaceae bacterium]|jgi:glycosyltransferase involved in cell wall biosynthesis|nr:hypothetical protein [Miltoncostaeaceae bacterium]
MSAGERKRLVVAVDVDAPPQDLDLEGHDGALIVVMLDGAPITRFTVSGPEHVERGSIPGELIATVLRRDLWWEIERRRLTRRLEERLGVVPQDDLRITVAVCTRDRPQQIEGALRSIAALDPAPDRVLIVDNAPTVPCREVVERYGFDYALEPKPGLDNARNRAIAECTTEIIAFTDDDCRPVVPWLADLPRFFGEGATGAVTGWGCAYRLDSAAQIAFEATGGFSRGWSVRRFDWESLDPAAAGSTGAGANMAYRVDLLRELGGFPPELDAGTPTQSGGDIYVLGRVLASGHRVTFNPASMVWHDHRGDVTELRRVMHGYGLGIGSFVSRSLIDDREPKFLSAAAWPLKNLLATLRSYRWKSAGRLEVLAAAEQARGLVEAPFIYAKARRRLGGPRHAPRFPRLAGRRRAARGPASGGSGRAELSVIVPTMPSRGPMLARCVAALNDQTLDRDRYEVIVVPNGPEARETALRGADRVLAVPEPGAAVARNAGAEAARGELLVFMDDDILAEPGCLEAHLSALREAPGVSLGPAYPPGVGSTLAEQASSRWWFDHYARKHRPGHRFTFVDFLTGNLGISRELYLELDGLDPAFGAHRREDWEMGCRILERGIVMRATPDAVAIHHHKATAMRLLKDALREGHGDVLLTGRHPVVHRSLPLWGRVNPDDVGGERWLLNLALARAVTGPLSGPVAAALAGLEAARLRGRWLRVVHRLMGACYRLGVQGALDAGLALPSRTPARTYVDIDSDAPIEVGVALGEIVFREAGVELTTVLPPDGQWDGQLLAEWAADGATAPSVILAGQRAET